MTALLLFLRKVERKEVLSKATGLENNPFIFKETIDHTYYNLYSFRARKKVF